MREIGFTKLAEQKLPPPTTATTTTTTNPMIGSFGKTWLLKRYKTELSKTSKREVG